MPITFCQSCPHNTKGLSNAVIHWQPRKGRQPQVRHVGSRSLPPSLWRLVSISRGQKPASFVSHFGMQWMKPQTIRFATTPLHITKKLSLTAPVITLFLPSVHYAHKHKPISHHLPTIVNQPKTHAQVQGINDELVWVTDLQYSHCHTN